MKRELSVVLAIVLVLGTFGAAKAVGGVEAGVKGGVNIANQTSNPDDQAPADSRTGLALGGFVGIPVLPNLQIQPEALFMMKGGEDSDAGTTSTYKLNYVEVPVLAKLGFMNQSPAHPSLFVGPSIGFAASSKADVAGATVDLKDNTKPFDVGVVVGAGLDFQNVGVDVRYTRGVTNVNDTPDSSTDVTNSVISIMGSFRFL